jgi:hypothetical protein
VGIVAGGVAVRLHDQALGEQGRRTVPDGSGLGGSREVDSLALPGEIKRLTGNNPWSPGTRQRAAAA